VVVIRWNDRSPSSECAAAWPLAIQAQHGALPVIGFLFSSTSEAVGPYIAGVTAGSAQTGYIDGCNVAIEYRMAEDHPKRSTTNYREVRSNVLRCTAKR
jgi:hypothetical protein